MKNMKKMIKDTIGIDMDSINQLMGEDYIKELELYKRKISVISITLDVHSLILIKICEKLEIDISTEMEVLKGELYGEKKRVTEQT